MSEREYEALPVTEETESDCERLLRGEVSVEELVKEILSRPAKAV